MSTQELWKNYINSGAPETMSAQVRNKFVFINTFSIVGVGALVIFGLQHLYTGGVLIGRIELAISIVGVVNVLALRAHRDVKKAALTIVGLMFLLLNYLFVTGGYLNTGLYWFATFPLLALFLLRKRVGLPWIVAFFLSLGTLALARELGIVTLPYSGAQILQLFGSLIAVSALSYFYQTYEEQYVVEIEKRDDRAAALTAAMEKELVQNSRAKQSLEASVQDLSDMKKAMLNILEDVQEEKMRADADRQKLLLATHAARIGVWEWDVIRNILIWDDRMYELYGIQREQFNGAYEAWQAGLHPDDRKAGGEAIAKALKGEKDFDVTFRVVWPDTSVHNIKAYATVERDPKGVPFKMVGVNWDITKEYVVDKEKTEFVSLASHQLKTPIGAIQWNMEMLLAGDYGKISSKQKEVLAETYKMSTRMNDLVNALLNISRIEMGVFIIEPKPTDIAKLCEEVIKEMEPRLVKKGHELRRDLDGSLKEIPADEKLLRIVYQNFISNAIKYTPDKGKIEVSLTADSQNVTFSVKNNGAPIPKADQSKIFTKMFRASNAQEQDPDGNGLGLYVVKQIVENAGGKIWFTSQKGADTVFACSFPLSGMKAKSGTKKLS